MEQLPQSEWHERYFRSDRIELLNDGVYAIVLTLLVLDLHIPRLANVNSTSELWAETKKLTPHFVSFFITFLWIVNSWFSGQSFSRLIVKRDAVLIWIQIFMLMLTCLIPFPTALMGEYPHNSLGVVYFGVLVITTGILVVCFTQYAVRKNFISPHVDIKDLKKRMNIVPITIPLTVIPIVVAFYYPIVAQLLYFAFGVSWIFQTSSWKLKKV